jgi:hypothetical protein
MRFDNGKKTPLRKPEDMVTPEDFKKAAEAAAAAKKQAASDRGADAPANK